MYRKPWVFTKGVAGSSSTTFKRIFPSILLASGLRTDDVVFAGFVVSGQSWTVISSSIGLGWIVGAEPLRVPSFPLFLGGVPGARKIFS
jgi:hypothetical protein